MTEKLHFSISGEFITKFAREQFYNDHKFDYALDFLKNTTECDLSDNEHTLLCLEILAGTKDIIGVAGTENYDIINNDNGSFAEFINKIESICNQYKQIKHELHEMQQKFGFVCGQLSDWKLKDINGEYHEQYDEYLFESDEYKEDYIDNDTVKSDITSPIFEPFIEKKNNTVQHKYAEYGWLEPNGTYHEVEWANHATWAGEYLKEHYPMKKYENMYIQTDDDGNTKHYFNGDFLLHCLGWVLLHSPGQGMAYPQYDATKRLTKEQKKFLFDYFTERNRTKEASQLYSDDTTIP